MTGRNIIQCFSLRLTALVLVLLVGAASLAWLNKWQIDLTQGKLYTLSQGTRNIIAGIEQPITLQFYYSESQTRDIPMLRNYAGRVQDMLREYERKSQGKIQLKIVHPEPFSEAEDEAATAGLQAMPDGRGDKIYLGLVGSVGDRSENIAVFNPQKENLLEYQLSQLVYRLNKPKQITVGVIGDLPIFRGVDPKTNRVRPDWLIVNQLRQLFDLRRMIDPNVDKIDDDLSLLMVVHPHKLPEKTLFAIDQFVLRGGKLLVFVDPLAEADDSDTRLLATGFSDRSSDLEQLFAAWGVDYDAGQVVLDLGNAHRIPAQQAGQPVPHVGILSLEGDGINRTQNVIADLENINIASAGSLAQHPGSRMQFVPLLTSSLQTDRMDTQTYSMIGNHAELLEKMQPSSHRYTFAAWVSGAVKTAFPEGKPATSQFSGEVLQESKEPIQAIVVADTDVLADRMWVDRQEYYGQTVATPFAANGDMVVNMLDALGGSVDLINLRSRGTYQRPFTRVDDLEKAASSRLREQQDALAKALSDTESKISQLNAAAANQETGEVQELTPAQKQAVEMFEQERLKIRKNLREVQHQLNSDVDKLGAILKIINIAAVPLLLIVLALLAAGLRRYRMRRIG